MATVSVSGALPRPLSGPRSPCARDRPPIVAEGFHPLMDLSSSLECRTCRRYLAVKCLPKQNHTKQSDSYEVSSFLASASISKRLVQRVPRRCYAPSSGFLNLLTVYSSKYLSVLFHTESAFKVPFPELYNLGLPVPYYYGLSPHAVSN